MRHVLVLRRQKLGPRRRQVEEEEQVALGEARRGPGRSPSASAAGGSDRWRPRRRAPWSCWASIQSWVGVDAELAARPRARARSPPRRWGPWTSRARPARRRCAAARRCRGRPRRAPDRGRRTRMLRGRRRARDGGRGALGAQEAVGVVAGGEQRDLHREAPRPSRTRPCAVTDQPRFRTPWSAQQLLGGLAAFWPAASASKSVTTSSAVAAQERRAARG